MKMKVIWSSPTTLFSVTTSEAGTPQPIGYRSDTKTTKRLKLPQVTSISRNFS